MLFALLGATLGSAQSEKQKRVTSVALGTATEGSRVTVLSDSALDDYEAYRRGDRFYVRIPAVDFASVVPNLSGAGFEDVRVQKAADGSIISFRLQPGTAARVDQRSNRLDVVFSTLARSDNTGATPTHVTGRAQNPSGSRTVVTGLSPASSIGNSPGGRDSSSSNANAIEPQNQGTFAPQQSTVELPQRSGVTVSQANSDVSSSGVNDTATGPPSVASSPPESLLASMSPGQPTTVEQQSTPAAQGTISSQTQPVRSRFSARLLPRSWLLTIVAAILLVILPLLLIRYRRARLQGNNGILKETGVQPKKAGNVGFTESEFVAETARSSEHEVEPVPLVPPPSQNRRPQKTVEPETVQEVPRVNAEREEEQPVEAEDRRRIAAERLKLEQRALMQVAIELTHRRAGVEEARGLAKVESPPFVESQEQMRLQEDQDVQTPSFAFAIDPERGNETEQESGIPLEIFKRLNSNESRERAAALAELASLGGGYDVFSFVSRAFDDESIHVRNAAAHALNDMQPDRAASFTRALREGSPGRHRRIGAALASSGLATNAINSLTGEIREKTYDAFSLLFLMTKAGEVQPLMQAIEEHANVEVRLAAVKLLALSGQSDIVPAFRRLAVRGSLPSEVRSAVMEAMNQISSEARENAHSVGGAAGT
ncbi:MAG: HEAT repeat domain-containing protein [Pyrinomonadaceae bacterium]